MNIDDNLEMDGVLNTTITEQFLANGKKDKRLNKLFTGDPEGVNVKRKSFKKELKRLWLHKGIDFPPEIDDIKE
jgi:hypothetical protein